MKKIILILLGFFSVVNTTYSGNYFVSPSGADTNDGISLGTAWKTMAFACSQVPAGDNIINLTSGEFHENTNSYPKAGVTIKGSGKSGNNKTTIKAPSSWEFATGGCTAEKLGFIIVCSNANNVTISDIEFIGTPYWNSNGAIYCLGSNNNKIFNVVVRDFRYAGLYIYNLKDIEIANCEFYNSAGAIICDASSLGNLTMRYITNGLIHDNLFVTGPNQGYGFRGRSQENVKIYNNTFDIAGLFDIEIAHKHEYGVEIYNNSFKRAVSVPRTTNQPNPNIKGYAYSVRIHDNVSTSSYGVKGSRNHVEIDHNIFYSTTKEDNRILSDFGADTGGPVWIHHNLALSCDRGFIFQTGNDKNLYIYNNTVFIDDKPGYTGAFFEGYKNTSGGSFFIKNNIIIGSATKSAKFISGSIPGLDVSNTVYQNVTGVLGTSVWNIDPKLTPEYKPSLQTSSVVDRGVEIGYPFLGSSPDIGAYEFDSTTGISMKLDSYNSESSILIYPNPINNGQFTIEIKCFEPHDELTIAIADITGKSIYTKLTKVQMIEIGQ